jgi:hypothetical protein
MTVCCPAGASSYEAALILDSGSRSDILLEGRRTAILEVSHVALRISSTWQRVSELDGSRAGEADSSHCEVKCLLITVSPNKRTEQKAFG